MENKKRFIIEIGTGIDIHGEDMTKAACRAVEDAVSRSCLCGLVEIVGLRDMDQVEVDIQIAAPAPEKVDLEAVMKAVPIGRKKARAVNGGLMVRGLCVPEFGPDRERIVVVNAALTVYVTAEK